MPPDSVKYGRFAPLIRYFHDDEPERQARNNVAAVVAGNIPFYPLYVAWFIGWRMWPSLLALLTLPLFLLVPAVNRRRARAGGWLLLVAGIADTALCTWGLGAASGVELFYVPTALLALILYRQERWTTRAGMLLAVLAFFLLGRVIGGGLVNATSHEWVSLTRMNAVSVTLLCVVILLLRWRLPPASSQSQSLSEPARR